jgi:hypothetical protein
MTDVAGTAEKLVQQLQRGNPSACAQVLAMRDEEYVAVLPRLCSFLASYDPRITLGDRRAAPAHASKVSAGCHAVHAFLLLDYAVTNQCVCVGGCEHVQIFAKWAQIVQQRPAVVRAHTAAMCEMVEWWAALLVNSDGELEDLAEAAECILTTWNTVASSDSSFAEAVLPCALACLASTYDEVRSATTFSASLWI